MRMVNDEGGVVVPGGIGLVSYRRSGRGSSNPEDAVSIFVDASKGEDARRARIATIEGLSDRLGSSSDEGAVRCAQTAHGEIWEALTARTGLSGTDPGWQVVRA